MSLIVGKQIYANTERTFKNFQACEAVATKLYPHQMYALAWMANRENHKDLGMQVTNVYDLVS